jgi:bacteriorhodopsin
MSALLDITLLADVSKIKPDDYPAFTFFIGCMAMMAASVFFLFEISNTDKAWKTSLLVSGLITFIAAVHYYYMRDYYISMNLLNEAKGLSQGQPGWTNPSPTFFRYVDWLLTVPLMCVEFYLITKKAGAKINLLWKLIFASVVMLVTGYLGEVGASADNTNATLWGTVSAIAYFYIVYLIWAGDVKKLAAAAGPSVAKANSILGWFVLVGWAIYPLGYLAGTGSGQWYHMFTSIGNIDIYYNIADAINKIGFGLVIYSLSRSNS